MSHYADRDSSRVMISRAEVIDTSESEDGLALVTLHGMHGEVLKKIHRLQPFGFAYRPPAGAHGMVMSVGGRRDNAFFFGGENEAKRPRDLQVGETAYYNDHGDRTTYRNGHIDTVTNGKHTTTTGGDCIVNTGGIYHINP